MNEDKTTDDVSRPVAGPVQRPVRPTLLTEKELLDIVDTLIRDRAYNRPAAVAIGVAVGAAVEAVVRERCLNEWNGLLLELRQMADDSADRGDVFAQRVVALLSRA